MTKKAVDLAAGARIGHLSAKIGEQALLELQRKLDAGELDADQIIALAKVTGNLSGAQAQLLNDVGLFKKTTIVEKTTNNFTFTVEQMNMLSPSARAELERLTLDRMHGRELPAPEAKDA